MGYMEISWQTYDKVKIVNTNILVICLLKKGKRERERELVTLRVKDSCY